ncbi:MAG: MFS transporter, partial [Actinomycetota bacterium]|nr:MFS transporter [Actinomycetota bacterium]
LYGRKPFFLAAISIFIIGSVLCTITTSMYELAVFRAVQGLGAGGLFSLAFAIIGDIVPPRERSRYQGYFVAVFGTSSVVGPLVGGGFAGADSLLGITGWRWVFLVNVPVAAAALIVVAKVLNIPHTRREHRIDWLGAAALAVGVVPLLLVVEQGQSWGWGSPRATLCYGIAAVGLAGFLLAEWRIGEDALLPLRLFRNSVFSVTSAAGLIVGIGMFGGIMLLPLYLQIVKGASPTEAGLLLLPVMAGIMFAAVVSGQLVSRTGRYKVFPVIGTALMSVALLLLHSRLGVDTPLWEADIYMALFGLGLGNCLQTLILAVQNAVSPREMGVATASATFFRQMGGTAGVAAFLAILFATVGNRIVEAFRVTVGTPEFQAAVADPAVRADSANAIMLQAMQDGRISGNVGGVLQDSSFLQHIDPRLARPFLIGFSDAMDLVFLVGAGVMFLGFVLMLFMKEIPLRTQSGLEARAAELAAEVRTGLAAETSAAPTPAPMAAEAVPSSRTEPLPDKPDHPAKPHPPAAAEVAPAAARPAGADQQRQLLIFGQVTEKSRNVPLPGATLTLTDLSGRQVDRDTSDSGGRYRLGAPTGGSYLIICASAAYQPSAALVAVADAPVRHDVVLSSAGTRLSGSVYSAGTGQPVAGATVTLVDVQGEVVGAVSTGADGRFSFLKLRQGHYTLTVTANSAQPVAHEIEVPSTGHITHDVEVAARVQLVGVVCTATGLPVPEALTTLIAADGQVVASVITDTEGRFILDDLNAGVYTLIATGYSPVAAEVHLDAGTPTETVITLRPPTLGPALLNDAGAGNGAVRGSDAVRSPEGSGREAAGHGDQ